MLVRRITLYLLLGCLFIADAGSTCVPVQCLKCNSTEETQEEPCALCTNNSAHCIDVPSDIQPNCKKDFQVSVNCSKNEIGEGEAITLMCLHNLPSLILMFGWKKNGEEILMGRNKSELYLEKVWPHDSGQYICFVNSSCGNYESSPHDVTVRNQSVVILVICGVCTLILVLVMGLVMKIKLKRDNAKHRERMRQKATMEHNSGPAPFTPRES